jgi:hypothetical protein
MVQLAPKKYNTKRLETAAWQAAAKKTLPGTIAEWN